MKRNRSGTNFKGKTVVLKLGSSSLSTLDGRFLNLCTISNVVEIMCKLKENGNRVLLVTSGAVSIGCQRLGIERPKDIITKQAIAAVGQSRLMRIYDDFFEHRGQRIAQVLLSRENLSQKHHYTNALNTFEELFRLGVIPIVNENDTVAVEELQFGDNDTLSALISSLVMADNLFLLTDVDALYTCDPKNPEAKAIHLVKDINELKVNTDSGSGGWGTGGMATKLIAARIGVAAGVTTSIIKSTELQHIEVILDGGRDVGTTFLPFQAPLRGDKKRWIAHGLRPEGKIYVDKGASERILKKSSLFAAGITKIEGNFTATSCVQIFTSDGIELGRGLTNYDFQDCKTLQGKRSAEFHAILGYLGPTEVIHRGNLALTQATGASTSSSSTASPN